MEKRYKTKIMLNIIIFILVAIFAILIFKESPNENYIERCIEEGGQWRNFNNACVDSCAYNRGEVNTCAQVITPSCDCGTQQCWNGESCAPI